MLEDRTRQYVEATMTANHWYRLSAEEKGEYRKHFLYRRGVFFDCLAYKQLIGVSPEEEQVIRAAYHAAYKGGRHE